MNKLPLDFRHFPQSYTEEAREAKTPKSLINSNTALTVAKPFEPTKYDSVSQIVEVIRGATEAIKDILAKSDTLPFDYSGFVRNAPEMVGCIPDITPTVQALAATVEVGRDAIVCAGIGHNHGDMLATLHGATTAIMTSTASLVILSEYGAEQNGTSTHFCYSPEQGNLVGTSIGWLDNRAEGVIVLSSVDSCRDSYLNFELEGIVAPHYATALEGNRIASSFHSGVAVRGSQDSTTFAVGSWQVQHIPSTDGSPSYKPGALHIDSTLGLVDNFAIATAVSVQYRA